MLGISRSMAQTRMKMAFTWRQWKNFQFRVIFCEKSVRFVGRVTKIARIRTNRIQTMKRLLMTLVATIAFAGLTLAGETTLKGHGLCAKCDLSETTKCQPVLQVTKDGKVETYYLEGAAAKDLHGLVCNAPRDNTWVTGSVREKDGKKWLAGKLLAQIGRAT